MNSIEPDPPITATQLFQNFTFNIQGQGHVGVKCQSHIASPTHYRLRVSVMLLCYHGIMLRGVDYALWSISRQLMTWRCQPGHLQQWYWPIYPAVFIFLSFHINRTTPSWNTAISEVDLDYSSSRSWVGSKVRIIQWIPHRINPLPMCSVSMVTSIHEIWPGI